MAECSCLAKGVDGIKKQKYIFNKTSKVVRELDPVHLPIRLYYYVINQNKRTLPMK